MGRMYVWGEYLKKNLDLTWICSSLEPLLSWAEVAIQRCLCIPHFSLESSLESSKLSSKQSRVNTQMRTSLPFPSTLSSLPLIDRVCAAKAARKVYKFTSHALWVLTRELMINWDFCISVWDFRLSLYSDLSTVCFVITKDCLPVTEIFT